MDGVLCKYCNRLFYNKSSLRRHVSNIHSIHHVPSKIKKKIRIRCPECQSNNFLNYTQLRAHIGLVHKIELQCVSMLFDSFEEFEDWKLQYEKTWYSHYVKNTASRPLKTHNCSYYYCHRSDSYVSSSRHIRNFKKIGTNKIGSTCPSMMKVKIYDDKACEVEFWQDHLGHTNEIERLNLTKKERALIAGKLNEGISVQNILEQVKESLGKEEDGLIRAHLITKKDIYNVRRDFNIACPPKLDKAEDESSIKLEPSTLIEAVNIKEDNVPDICKTICDEANAIIALSQEALHLSKEEQDDVLCKLNDIVAILGQNKTVSAVEDGTQKNEKQPRSTPKNKKSLKRTKKQPLAVEKTEMGNAFHNDHDYLT